MRMKPEDTRESKATLMPCFSDSSFFTLLAIEDSSLLVVGVGLELVCEMDNRILLERQFDHDPVRFMVDRDGFIDDILLLSLDDGDGPLLRAQDAFGAIRAVRTSVVQHRIVLQVFAAHPGVFGEGSPCSV